VSTGRNGWSTAGPPPAAAIADSGWLVRLGSGGFSGSDPSCSSSGSGARRSTAASTEPSTPAPVAVIAAQYGTTW
jgi:hypothetical protein